MGEVKMGRWIGKSSQAVIARLNFWNQKIDRQGNHFWVCDFVTPQGAFQGRIWPDDAEVIAPENLYEGAWHLVVPASGQWHSKALNRLKGIMPVANGLAWFDTPDAEKGERHKDWQVFRQWFGQIPYPALQAFVLQTFLDKVMRDSFFSLPASREHHHSWPGGLAEHSVEVAKRVASDLLVADPFERWVGSVAGLFHDIGKVRTMSADTSRRRYSELIHHESLTLELLSQSLVWLDQSDPDAGHLLRYLLTYQPAKEPLPHVPIAMVIRESDRLSAATSARRLAFASAPAWRRFATLDVPGPKNRFWRPPPGQRALLGPS